MKNYVLFTKKKQQIRQILAEQKLSKAVFKNVKTNIESILIFS